MPISGRTMCDKHSQAFTDMLAVLEYIVNSGTFFITAIEFDAFDTSVDGEDIKERARAAILAARKEMGE